MSPSFMALTPLGVCVRACVRACVLRVRTRIFTMLALDKQNANIVKVVAGALVRLYRVRFCLRAVVVASTSFGLE
eukprot:COSAG01_NODE_494_length_16322_cov_35.380879_1_plen_75_part_00